MRPRGRRATLTILLLGSLGLVATGSAPRTQGPDPGGLILASEQAEKKVSYSGTKVLRFYRVEDGSLAAERVVKVWHRSPEQTRVEMVTPAELLGMVVLEDGAAIWIFHPKQQSWRQMSWRAPEARPQLLLRNYDVQFVRRESVAGRPTFVLRLTSRNPGNPSKSVWVDTRTKLALRQELYDPAGRRLSASEFREISFEPSLPANLFSIPAEAQVERRGAGTRQPPWAAAARPATGFSIEPPRYVPAGYELVHQFCVKREDREFGHLRYTDGLNTISIFAERQSSADPEAQRQAGRGRRGGSGERVGDSQRGAHDPSITIQRDGIRYTVVGNISRKELRRMAESIPSPSRGPGSSSTASVGEGR